MLNVRCCFYFFGPVARLPPNLSLSGVNHMAQQAVADIGLIGLAVMGENLALNIADHGYKVAVYNRTTEVMKKFIARENPPGGLVGCETVKVLIAAIKRRRRFIFLLRAAAPVE